MRKVLTYTFLLVVLPVMSVSCNRKDETVGITSFEHMFSVEAVLPTMEQEPETKGYLGSYITAAWSEGDKVSVVNLTTGKILGGELSSSKSGTKTTFSGTVTGSITDGDRLSIVYPSLGATKETDFGTVTMNISEQLLTSNVPLITYAMLDAPEDNSEISGYSLDFYYALSYLKINLANLPAEAPVSRVALRNVPVEFTISINGTKTGFEISSDEERRVRGRLEISGSYSTSPSGTMTVAVGVMPSYAMDDRSIVVTVDGDGDYRAPLTSAKLLSHKYYNTIASTFEKIGLAGKTGFGVYDLKNGTVLDEYDELYSTSIAGSEDGVCDFSLLNSSTNRYWTMKGIPSEIKEGSSFNVRLYNYGINCPKGTSNDARVMMMESDGDVTKLWVKVDEYLFIVRK